MITFKNTGRVLSVLALFSALFSCSSVREGSEGSTDIEQYEFTVNSNGKGQTIEIDLKEGESFYYPLMAVWIEDVSGKFIQTLFVPHTIATGVFRYGRRERNRWTEAAKRAPQIVPYWAHRRGVKASDGLFMPEPDNPVPDAYSGATPTTGFVMTTRADMPLQYPFRVLLEINQNWDWNDYWHNNRFPGDSYYLMSAQPAVVYEAVIHYGDEGRHIDMKPAGHSHPSGSDGELQGDLSTLTTALKIAESITVLVKQIE